MCTGVRVCGGPVGGVILLTEVAFCRGLFPPGANFLCVIWVTPRPIFLTALTLRVDAGNIRESASELAIPESSVANVSAVASISNACGAAIAVVSHILIS